MWEDITNACPFAWLAGCTSGGCWRHLCLCTTARHDQKCSVMQQPQGHAATAEIAAQTLSKLCILASAYHAAQESVEHAYTYASGPMMLICQLLAQYKYTGAQISPDRGQLGFGQWTCYSCQPPVCGFKRWAICNRTSLKSIPQSIKAFAIALDVGFSAPLACLNQ